MMDGVNVNALQFEASVMDEPAVNSRAALYIYVNAMVPKPSTYMHCRLKLTLFSSLDVPWLMIIYSSTT